MSRGVEIPRRVGGGPGESALLALGGGPKAKAGTGQAQYSA
jgi:hypothetical protein